MAKPIYVLNGPNLNLLGTREPEVYGRETLEDLRTRCERKAAALGFSVVFRQSNHEGELVAWIQEARTEADGLIVNAGAFTHTSIALLDAVLACPVPAVGAPLYGRIAGPLPAEANDEGADGAGFEFEQAAPNTTTASVATNGHRRASRSGRIQNLRIRVSPRMRQAACREPPASTASEVVVSQ